MLCPVIWSIWSSYHYLFWFCLPICLIPVSTPDWTILIVVCKEIRSTAKKKIEKYFFVQLYQLIIVLIQNYKMNFPLSNLTLRWPSCKCNDYGINIWKRGRLYNKLWRERNEPFIGLDAHVKSSKCLLVWLIQLEIYTYSIIVFSRLHVYWNFKALLTKLSQKNI